jgi:hypothetical protein
LHMVRRQDFFLMMPYKLQRTPTTVI